VLLDNLHGGVFADWDIMNSNLNKAAYDAPNKMGYCYSTQSNGLYAGIKLLSNTAPAIHYAMDNLGGGAGGIDPVGGISTSEKFTGISTNRANAGGAGNGNDVIHFISSGPFVLNPNDTIEVAFAYLAGDSLTDIQNSAIAAQNKYNNSPIIVKNNTLNNPYFSLYPNPVNDELTLLLNNEVKGNFNIRILDLQGKVIESKQYNSYNGSIQFSLTHIENGIYFIEVLTGNTIKSEKFVILK
jgi:hypothetical protein